MSVFLTDPIAPVAVASTRLGRLGVQVLEDPRDLPLLRTVVTLSGTMVPAAIYLALPGNFRWWLAGLYLAFYLYMLGPYILLLHNTSHRRLLARRFAFLSPWIPCVLGPLFGETTYTYFAHHVGMHHPENNLEDDLSSTMRFQRDSPVDFVRYFGRFVFLGLLELLRYFGRKRRPHLARMAARGELAYLAVAVACLVYDWRVGLVLFVLPLLISRFAMMSGNWAQHAFIDAASPSNSYRNSLTCINSVYNRRCFNDGYHIGHHLKQTRHWTDLPVEFGANEERYAREGAIVFERLDFMGVWLLLMLQRYDVLARRFVRLAGDTRDDNAIALLLRTRTRRIPVRRECP